MKEKKVYLTLQNGQVFEGKRFGADADAVGELVFTTGMTGYIETITDPSYCGQIVLQTYPLIGNYGIMESDCESEKPRLAAYVVREYCTDPSNFRCEGTLDAFLKKHNIPGIYGIDTREITRIIRENGTMNAVLSSEPGKQADPVDLSGAVDDCTCKTEKIYAAKDEKRTVVLWDFGALESIVRELTERGCKVIRVPSTYTAEQILSYKPDGLVLSNGPGNPQECTRIVAELKKLIGKTAIFGIGLGHQLFALAMGGEVRKMKHCHRGSNQPVKEAKTGNVYLSMQNHGYKVSADSILEGQMRFINVNDGTCAGMDYPKLNAMTVQFYPEARGGATDGTKLFDEFTAMTDGGKQNA